LREAYAVGASNGQQFSLEAANETYWFELSIARKSVTEGDGPRLIVLSRNITQRKLIEEALVAREREFRTLAENLPSALVRLDTQFRYTYANRAFIKRRELGVEHILGKPLPDLMGDYAPRSGEFLSKLQRLLITGEPDEIEIGFAHGRFKGEVHHIRFVAERDTKACIVGILAIGNNITALKQKEREIMESRDMLRELAARRDSAREEERKHIAREIHDELGQMLTAQRLDIITLQLQFAEAPAPLGESLRHLLSLTDKTIGVVRNVATHLRPAVLDMGIGPALEWLAAEFRARVAVTCHLMVDDSELELNEEQSIAVFRIVQESLTNVARYAEAQQVLIHLSCHANHIQLTVRDDGKGFEIRHGGSKSFGLLGIRERALMIGGEANFTSAPFQGTMIEVKIPHRRKRPRQARSLLLQ